MVEEVKFEEIAAFGEVADRPGEERDIRVAKRKVNSLDRFLEVV